MTARFLIVDDSSTIRRAFINTLPTIFKSEVSITEAGDGIEALEVLKNNMDFHFIMLDVNMPNMNGKEFLKKVRATKKWNHIKIVMATTEAEKSTVKNILSMGANGYIIKPLKPVNIAKALRPHALRIKLEMNI